MNALLKIDGMRGEGGGQILRTSLALSAITGQPFRMVNIRSRRKRPGLMRQHLTAVRAMAQICNADVEGDTINSTSLVFKPGVVRPGHYRFSVGTAGSATLVLQTVLPPLLTARTPSKLTLEGGTHNMMAPPYDFLEKSFIKLLNGLGADVKMSLESWGFYPAGGGRFEVDVVPGKALKALNLEKRGELISKRCRAVISALPEIVAERELAQVKKRLNWSDTELVSEIIERPLGPGNILMFELEYESVTEVISSFGEKGIVAERVASNGINRVKSYLTSNAAVGEYLADQLLIPAALAGEGSFTCTELSSHTLTNMDVIRQFLDIEFVSEKLFSDCYRVSVK